MFKPTDFLIILFFIPGNQRLCGHFVQMFFFLSLSYLKQLEFFSHRRFNPIGQLTSTVTLNSTTGQISQISLSQYPKYGNLNKNIFTYFSACVIYFPLIQQVLFYTTSKHLIILIGTCFTGRCDVFTLLRVCNDGHTIVKLQLL